MKKNYLFLSLLLPVLALAACGNAKPSDKPADDPTPSEPGDKEPEQEETGKIKEIALREKAPKTVHVTERMSTTVLYEIRPNKGQTLKTADKKVIVTSSDPTVLNVEKTEAAISTFLNALKPGKVKLTIQSAVQEKLKLEIDMNVLDSVFDRKAQDGFFGNSWDNCDFSHEVDEEDPYIKTVAEDQINHQFYFRDSYLSKCYVESEFTFYSEQDGGAHMPKIGFVFSTNEINDTDLQSVSMIFLDTDCRGGNTTFHNIGYNEIANGAWGWDKIGNPLAKCYTVYRSEEGIKVGETFKMGVVKEGYNYHLYLNGEYKKSIKTTEEGFSVDKTYTQAAPTICGMFDFKSEVKYSNYLLSTDEELINSKIPATPDFTDAQGN